MFIKSVPVASVGRRFLSNANPRLVIARGALQVQAISAAKTEAELEAALAIDLQSTTNLPASIKGLEPFLNSSTGATQAPYVPDPNAWQNLPFLQFVAREAKRPINIWILLIGPAVFLYLVSSPLRKGLQNDDEIASKSLYLQQLRGLKAMALPDEHH